MVRESANLWQKHTLYQSKTVNTVNATHRVGDVGRAEGECHAEGGGHGAALRPQHGGDHLEGQLIARGQRHSHEELPGQRQDHEGQGGLGPYDGIPAL